MNNESESDALSNLRSEYQKEFSKADRLRVCIEQQVSTLLTSSLITLGVPIESRVKSWSSIEEKIKRKSHKISKISELTDLVGIRLIILFKNDRDRLEKLIEDNFEIISAEDAGNRLGEAQFGYQSYHYIIRLKSEWLKVPSYADLGDISVELQARTVAQHIWAAASHKLQYKREDSVPVPLRRTINRISALLEIVDLEFERVLRERDEYLAEQSRNAGRDLDLNVDLLDMIATSILPKDNRDPDDDDLDDVLQDLLELGVDSSDKLENLLRKNLDKIMEEDRRNIPDFEDYDPEPERTARGVYFTFAGLIRQALIEEFGLNKARKAFKKRRINDDDDIAV